MDIELLIRICIHCCEDMDEDENGNDIDDDPRISADCYRIIGKHCGGDHSIMERVIDEAARRLGFKYVN